ncbi:MAG: phosphoribosylformylglycinamidine cyclo-ligase [Clostridiales bacterium]|nr:phosphoribosylformylglycinamidine cyclo-ligase [Clostridiales bacterium]
MNMSENAYKAAGVDVEAGYESVRLIKDDVKKTAIEGVLGGIGGFGGLFQVPKGYDEPVLVSGTDGVGTKIRAAFLLDKHDTIGQDCVAMCVNDIVCSGAKPLFFLDYIAIGKNVPEKVAQIVKGVADGCVLAGCALVGGETAEHPGLMPEDEYDLAGFSVGVVEKSKITDGDKAKAGDKLIGIASSGVHSNGYSLVRKLFDLDGKNAKEILNTYNEELGKTVGETLLTPTRIYVKPILKLIDEVGINTISHITGGGFIENVPRMLPDGLKAVIHKGTWEVLPIFKLMEKMGNIPERDMYNTFNMGIGMIVAVDADKAQAAVSCLEAAGERACIIGELVCGEKSVEIVDDVTGEVIR